MSGKKRKKQHTKNGRTATSPPLPIEPKDSGGNNSGSNKSLSNSLWKRSEYSILAMVCALVGFLLYINAVWACGFCYDDSAAIQKNPDVFNVKGDGVMSPFVDVWKHDFWGVDIRSAPSNKSYRPLVILTFRLNAWISHEPWIFHLTNALLFSLACWLVVNVTLPAATVVNEKRGGGDDAVMTVLLSGMWFASHPIHTEAVTSIVGRAEVMAAIFCLVGAKLVHSQAPLTTQLAGTVSFFLACLCKETAVVLPLIFGAADVAYLILAPKRRPGTKTTLGLMARAICLSITSMAYLLFRVWLFGDSETGQTLALSPIHINFVGHLVHMNKLRTAIYIQTKYVKLLVWPGVLSCDYNIGVIEPIRNWMSPEMAFSALVFFGILAWLLFALHRLHKTGETTLLLALGWTFGPLVPASHIVGIGTVMAERLLFLPSIGATMLLCQGLSLASDRFPKELRNVQNLFIVCIIYFSFQTVTRNMDWASTPKLFATDLESHPEAVKLLINRASHSDIEPDTAFDYATRAQRVLDRNAPVLKHAPYPHALRVMARLKSQTDVWPEGASHKEVVSIANRIIDMGNQFGIPEWGWIHEKKGRAIIDISLSTGDQSILQEALEALQVGIRYRKAPSASLHCLVGSIFAVLRNDIDAHENYKVCFALRDKASVDDRRNHAIALMRLSGVHSSNTTAVKKWGQITVNEIQKLIEQLDATDASNLEYWKRNKNAVANLMRNVDEKEKNELLNLVESRG